MGEKMPSRKSEVAGGEEPSRKSGVDAGEKKPTRKREVAGGGEPTRKSGVDAGEERPTRKGAADMDEEKPSREVVAGAGEVLEYLTCVLRGEEEGELKNTSARMKAAELLGKRMGLFEEGAEAVQEPVVIIDDVREGAESAEVAERSEATAGDAGVSAETNTEMGVIAGGVRVSEERAGAAQGPGVIPGACALGGGAACGCRG